MKKNESGLTDDEQKMIEMTVECWNIFILLERTHPDELREFRDAIHRVQDLIAMRIIRRDYPGFWQS